LGASDSPSLGSDGRPRAGRPFLAAARRLRQQRGQGIVEPLVALAVIATVWELGATAAASLLIPTFTETVTALVALIVDPRLWQALAISNQALVVGFAVAVAVGLPLGLALGRYRGLAAVLNPYLTILLTVPMAGLIPLLIMSVGIRFEARVLVVFLFTVVVLVVNARAGVREVDPDLIEMANSFGSSERQLWGLVLLPASVPAVMIGLRLGLSHAVTGMVIVELLLVAAGIGHLILQFQAFLQPGSLYATVVVVVLEALALISIANWLARRVAPWAEPARA
jgi:NitT/TauT family transport system permease protein